MWHVYICDRNGQLYTGITTDLRNRMRQHGAKLSLEDNNPGLRAVIHFNAAP